MIVDIIYWSAYSLMIYDLATTEYLLKKYNDDVRELNPIMRNKYIRWIINIILKIIMPIWSYTIMFGIYLLCIGTIWLCIYSFVAISNTRKLIKMRKLQKLI